MEPEAFFRVIQLPLLFLRDHLPNGIEAVEECASILEANEPRSKPWQMKVKG